MWPLSLLTFQCHGNYLYPSSLRFLRYLTVASYICSARNNLEIMKRAGKYARVDNEIIMVYY